MKQAEYVQGPKAQENFEEGMKALFKVPKRESCKGREETGFSACSKEEAETFRQGLEGDLLRFPRPCRFVVERVGSFAC